MIIDFSLAQKTMRKHFEKNNIIGIKFGYEGFSAKSCTSDTDRPSLAPGIAECKNEDCLYHECKILQREHE